MELFQMSISLKSICSLLASSSMPISFHGHRPACFRSPEEPNDPAGSNSNAVGTNAQTVNLGFFKLKIHQKSARQTSLLAQLPTRQKSTEEYFAEWDGWAQAGGASSGNRTEAVSRMKIWLDNNQTDEPLNLNGLGLSSLPDNLPPTLHTLYVRSNQLSSLPDNLPPTLHTLYARSNQLSSLPDNLPPTLHTLYASDNQLSSLPDNLPPTLHTLDASDNQLSSLPDNLPPTLHTLYARSNQLSSLPDNLPPTLHTLDARDNQLSSLPENILALPNTCTIYIDASHLSDAVRNRLAAAMNAPGYDNVHIDYNMGGQRNVQARSLQEEVSGWSQEAGSTAPIDWSTFQSEHYATQFAQFLGRLRETSEYLNVNTKPNFQERVENLLRQLQNNPELRATCFNLAQDAVDTCGDRVALRLLNMETVCLDKRMETDINTGKFDNDPQPVLNYCKAQYRQQILADAASAKIKTLNFCDEIEVRLGFIVAFSREFKLTAQMDTLLYAACSNIAPEDIYEARKQLTNQAFTNDTKKFYRPFFEKLTHGNPSPIDRLNNLPDYRKPPLEMTQNTHSFHEFLMNSPSINLLLKRRYTVEVSSLEKQIKQGITKKQEAIYSQLETLNPADTEYSKKSKKLQQQYDNLPNEVSAQMKQTMLMRFCSENNVNADIA